MRVIFRHRMTGRTEELIRLCAEAEKEGEVSYIVCSSQDEANRIFRKATKMSLTIGFPLTYEEFLYRQYTGKNIQKFFIDNVDHLLQRLTAVQIDTITIEREQKK